MISTPPTPLPHPQDTAATTAQLTSLQRRLQDDLQPHVDRLAAAAAASEAKVGALDARTAAVQKAQYDLQEWMGADRRKGKVRVGGVGTSGMR